MAMKAKQFAEEIIRRVRGSYLPVTEYQVYSTDETVIGAYMGKPLYRKVIPFDVNTYVDDEKRRTFTVATVPDVDKIVNKSAMYSVTTGSILQGTTWREGTPALPQYTNYCSLTNGTLLYNLQIDVTVGDFKRV